ncbi:hypothetical protein [Halovenus sp. HT40]|uniref:hypothetical protein n=1 Tax=Halovenus sp. HT40 TaxID=3126691 RepID=UPI00300F1B05
MQRRAFLVGSVGSLVAVSLPGEPVKQPQEAPDRRQTPTVFDAIMEYYHTLADWGEAAANAYVHPEADYDHDFDLNGFETVSVDRAVIWESGPSPSALSDSIEDAKRYRTEISVAESNPETNGDTHRETAIAVKDASGDWYLWG